MAGSGERRAGESRFYHSKLPSNSIFYVIGISGFHVVKSDGNE
jgi:hypothetical protein